MPWLQLRFNYNTTTIQLWCITHGTRLLPIRRKQKMNTSIFRCSRIVVEPQSNRMHIVILITSIIVKCDVVSSYHSCIGVELQLWYRCKTKLSIQIKLTDGLPNNEKHRSWHILKNSHDLIKVLLSHNSHVLKILGCHTTRKIYRWTSYRPLNENLTKYLIICAHFHATTELFSN